MKAKSILITLLLTLSCASTVFAESNDETTKQFYDRPGVAYLVTGDYVRVRTHPTTYGYIICELRKGEWVKDFGNNSQAHQDDNGMKWRYIIMKDGHVGWVSADFLDLRC